MKPGQPDEGHRRKVGRTNDSPKDEAKPGTPTAKNTDSPTEKRGSTFILSCAECAIFFAQVEKFQLTRRKKDNGTARDPSKDEVFFLSFRSGLHSLRSQFCPHYYGHYYVPNILRDSGKRGHPPLWGTPTSYPASLRNFFIFFQKTPILCKTFFDIL